MIQRQKVYFPLWSRTWKRLGERGSNRPELPTIMKDDVRELISMNLDKILKDFKLTTSFKTMVNLDNTRRLAKSSATTTTSSGTMTRCKKAADVYWYALGSCMSNVPLYVGEELVFGLHFGHQNLSFKPIFVLFLESLREQACTREPVIPRFDKWF